MSPKKGTPPDKDGGARPAGPIPRSALRKLEASRLSTAEKECLAELMRLLADVMEEIEGSPEQEAFYKRLADALIDHVDLLTCIQQPVAELDALKRISFNLTASLDLSVVLDGVVSEALRLVKNANDANIFLYSEDRLTFGAALDSAGNRETNFAEPRPDGLTYSVAHQKQMIVVEDMRSHPFFVDAPGGWAGSIVGLPLMMGTRVVGVMNLARSIRGAFSPAEIRLLTLLADQAAIAIVNARLHQAVSRQARIDGLTGLPNRRGLDEQLEGQIAHAGQSGCVFSVVMLDLDGFKKINDTYGHDAGDEILRQVALALARTVRSSDFLARYGGDELTLILPGTDLLQAEVVAKKIQERMQTLPLSLPEGRTVTLGMSGGIALYPRHGDTAASLLRAADGALYRAKRSGRNRILVALDEG